MLTSTDIKNKLRQIKPLLADKYHVSQIGYFGSYVTGDQDENSDVDILVEFSKPIGWGFFTLEKYLENILDTKVDLVTKNALNKQLKEIILKQVQYI
ncbi:nucleotidyltransferase family protein [Flavobacteriales bacterium AH-315-E23]|nr:nucleotidyltransferase family protein [Flavobacteriales bacterium AH-315-E23]